MNNRKSPAKQQQQQQQQQQRMRNSQPIPVVSNVNRSMSSSYSKNSNFSYRNYSKSTSPTAMSASLSPAVPLFYANTYADPPDCSVLPKPPESWYLKSNDENLPNEIIEEKAKPKQKSYYKKANNNRGFYSPFYSSTAQTPPYISVKA